MPRRSRRLCSLLAAACLAACGQDQSELPTPEPVAEAEAVGLIAGTPEGDLEEWVTDMRTGLDSVTTVLSDRADAHKRVLDLYVGRQEYLEMYYGPGGRMSPPELVSEAVKQTEARFHELMRLTGTTPPAAEAAVRKAVANVQQQLDRVMELSSTVERRVRGPGGAGSAQ